MLDTILRERLQAVEERLTAACQRSGRPRGDVTMVAVTKTISAELAALLPGLGVLDLGESRPQELWHKAEVVRSAGFSPHDCAPDSKATPAGADVEPAAPRGGLKPALRTSDHSPIRWHMIGHMQRNKIDRTLPLVHMIHSVDSVRLLQAIDTEAIRQDVKPSVLLEVNTSGEASKQGFEPGQLADLAPAIRALKQVRVRGLMTMAAFQEQEACRPCFVKLRCLRDELCRNLGQPLEHLSMGMTNDFEVAVEEGATLVRLGTVLFDGLENAVV